MTKGITLGLALVGMTIGLACAEVAKPAIDTNVATKAAVEQKVEQKKVAGTVAEKTGATVKDTKDTAAAVNPAPALQKIESPKPAPAAEQHTK